MKGRGGGVRITFRFSCPGSTTVGRCFESYESKKGARHAKNNHTAKSHTKKEKRKHLVYTHTYTHTQTSYGINIILLLLSHSVSELKIQCEKRKLKTHYFSFQINK